MKATWAKPQLIELVRSKTEEAVLQFCKTQSTGAYPNNNATGCSSMPDLSPCGPSPSGVHLNAIVCAPCSTPASS
jgi:hypothetical protein